jgi:ABC-2 type transport system ATP-binding protein
VESLVKEFSRPKRKEGRFAGLRTLVTRERVVTRAVDKVSFEVASGELVGYIGPNGAGKSTTIKMMTGILVPTAGVLEVNGLVPYRDRERNALQMGVVFGQRSQLWWDLPLRDSFDLIATMYRVPRGVYRRNLAILVELLGVGEFLDRPVRQLSLGQRMRGDLVAAMVYEPRILYLDEPTIGLDVVAKESMRSFLEEMNDRRGTTIVLTTHDLADVERLCSRVILIDHGTVLYDGRVAALKAAYAPYRVLVVEFRPDAPAPSRAALEMIDGVDSAEVGDGRASLRFTGERVGVSRLIGQLTGRFPVADLSIVEPDLESVVRHIYLDQVGTV